VIRRFSYKIEKKQDTGLLLDFLSIFVALVVSLLITYWIIASTGADVSTVLLAIVRGAFGSKTAVVDTLLTATPIMLTGLATVVAFRAKIWNIGQEGQLYAGAMTVTFIILTFPNLSQIPSLLYIPLLLTASVVGGLLWGSIPGILKAKYNVNEIIVTVMLNYIILYLITFLLNGVWQEPGSFYYNTIKFPESAFLPMLFGTRLHLGFIIAIILAFATFFLLWQMKLGFEIRSIGSNPTASKYKGINTKKIILVVMLLSGAISGLAGGVEILGVHHKLIYGFSNSFGFTGILIALLGRLHPLGVILASLFFGALRNGSVALQIYSNISRELVTLLIGLIIIMLLLWEALFKYRIRRVEDVS
jgi:general nucleoside transport system permease protein